MMKGWMDGTPSFLAGSNHYSCCPVTIGQQQWLWRVCVCELYLVASQIFFSCNSPLLCVCVFYVFFSCGPLLVSPLSFSSFLSMHLFLLHYSCVCSHSIASFFCSCVLSFSEQLQQHSTHTHREKKTDTLNLNLFCLLLLFYYYFLSRFSSSPHIHTLFLQHNSVKGYDLFE